MRTCTKCGREKPRAEYYVYPNGGLYAHCKNCLCSYRKDRYHHGGGKDRDRLYHYLNRDKIAALNKSNQPRNNNRRYDSAKSMAYIAVSRALHAGILVRPPYCEECGAECKPIAYHGNGYDIEHRLDVQWLCTTCHSLALHPEYREVISAYQNQM